MSTSLLKTFQMLIFLLSVSLASVDPKAPLMWMSLTLL
uniref:Uncharacterized protein n=1 Tax=Arundo donax TaxID=35708 RepID=A0A0A9FXU0_ARUDO